MNFAELEISGHAQVRWRERISSILPTPVQFGEMVRDGQRVRPSKGANRWRTVDPELSGWRRSIFVKLEDVVFTLRPLGRGRYILTTIMTDLEFRG